MPAQAATSLMYTHAGITHATDIKLQTLYVNPVRNIDSHTTQLCRLACRRFAYQSLLSAHSATSNAVVMTMCAVLQCHVSVQTWPTQQNRQKLTCATLNHQTTTPQHSPMPECPSERKAQPTAGYQPLQQPLLISARRRPSCSINHQAAITHAVQECTPHVTCSSLGTSLQTKP
jgi:hypothetical protein